MKINAPRADLLLPILSEMFPDSSKSAQRSWVTHKRVYIDGKVAKTVNAKVAKGQTVELKAKTETISNDIELLYVDHDIVVINKPEGLLSVATDKDDKINAHAILKRHFHPKRIFVVHRLDRETSGVMVFARTEHALWALKESLAANKVGREYYAIVEGNPDEGSGTWRSYLIEGQDLKMRPTSNTTTGELAISHYEVIDRHDQGALLRITLETGKKNQIRAHCQQAGYSIAGDTKYGGTKNASRRMALHAHKLQFQHPRTLLPLAFESPIPATFKHIFKLLRSRRTIIPETKV